MTKSKLLITGGCSFSSVNVIKGSNGAINGANNAQIIIIINIISAAKVITFDLKICNI